MSEKVKLTKEQSEAIEKLKNDMDNREIILTNINLFGGFYVDNDKSIVTDMDFDVLARALYIGYEVEPEFKENDWVVPLNGGFKRKIKPYRILRVDERKAWLDCELWVYEKQIRHATPEEIAEEKERRWWKKHGRGVKEIRKGDIVYIGDELYVSVKTVGDYVFRDTGNDLWNLGDVEKVVCFAEDRLDGDFDE